MIKYTNNSCASPVMTVILITRENIETLLFILSSEHIAIVLFSIKYTYIPNLLRRYVKYHTKLNIA